MNVRQNNSFARVVSLTIVVDTVKNRRFRVGNVIDCVEHRPVVDLPRSP